MQQWHEAVEKYRKSVELEPNSLEAQDHLGFALDQLGDEKEAIASYRKALQISPDSDVVNYHLAEVLRKQETITDLGEVFSCYRRAINLNPYNLEALEQAIKLSPNDFELYRQQGKL